MAILFRTESAFGTWQSAAQLLASTAGQSLVFVSRSVSVSFTDTGSSCSLDDDGPMLRAADVRKSLKCPTFALTTSM